MDINKVLSKLDKVKQIGHNKWKSCCPLHQERTPSFFITIEDDRIKTHCFGCQAKNIDLINSGLFEWNDLLPERQYNKPTRPEPTLPAREVLLALVREVSIIKLCTDRIFDGEIIEPREQERFKLACERIEKALHFIR